MPGSAEAALQFRWFRVCSQGSLYMGRGMTAWPGPPLKEPWGPPPKSEAELPASSGMRGSGQESCRPEASSGQSGPPVRGRAAVATPAGGRPSRRSSRGGTP